MIIDGQQREQERKRFVMKKRILALLTSVLIASLSVMPVLADNYTDTDWQNTGSVDKEGTIAGPTTTLNQYLTFPKGTPEVPDDTVTYTLTVPAESKTIGGLKVFSEGGEGDGRDHPIIYVGILSQPAPAGTSGTRDVKVMSDSKYDSTVPKVTGTMTFSPSDSADRKDGSDNTTADPANLIKDDYHFVEKDITIDFSNITFTEPGIYRYILEEKSSNPLVTDDIELDGLSDEIRFRTIDVYVTDDQTDGSHKLSTSVVVYQGKLDNPDTPFEDLPHVDTGYQWSELIIDGNESGYNLSRQTWAYTVTEDAGEEVAGDVYEYTYDANNGGWVETITFAVDADHTPRTYGGETVNNGDTKVTTNRTTHLSDALGDAPAPITITDYADAKEKGVLPDAIQSVDWEDTDQNGNVSTYKWNSTSKEWDVTSVNTPVEEEPIDDAKPLPDGKIEYINPSSGTPVTVELTYGQAKNVENITVDILQGHDWEVQNAPNNGDKTTYRYESGIWVKYIEYAPKTASDLPDKATPSPSLTTDKVKYSYAEKMEREAQKDSNYNQAAEEAKVPNGVEPDSVDYVDLFKTDHYINEYNAYNITLNKIVTGNQGSRDKYFQFEVKLENAGAKSIVIVNNAKALNKIPTNQANQKPNEATEYTYQQIVTEGNAPAIKYKDMDPETAKLYVWKNGSAEFTWDKTQSKWVCNQTSINVDIVMNSDACVMKDKYAIQLDDNGSATFYVYLNDGDSITFEGVKKGAKYSVTEADGGKDGYKTTAEIKEETDFDSKTGTDESTKIVMTDAYEMVDEHLYSDAEMTYTNDKKGVIPTGVIMSVTGGAAMVALAAVYFVLRRRKDEEYYY